MTSKPPIRPRRTSLPRPRDTSQPPSHLALGAEGEARAARYLESKGYRIVARNVRAGGVELDLVARHRGWIVFVEVKARRSERFGPPESAVHARKRARLVTGALAWLQENPGRRRGIRFDVIAWTVSEATGTEREWRVRHFENAFEVGD